MFMLQGADGQGAPGGGVYCRHGDQCPVSDIPTIEEPCYRGLGVAGDGTVECGRATKITALRLRTGGEPIINGCVKRKAIKSWSQIQ